MKLDKVNKIAYLAHPTNKEEVDKARALGYEIIDIRFAPEGLEDTGVKKAGDSVSPAGKGLLGAAG